MAKAYIGIGSNILPAKNVLLAIRLLSLVTKVEKVSTVYRTRAEGKRAQPDYYNCVVEIKTAIFPDELKKRVLLGIEGLMGRIRTRDKFASRTIDLDLILYEDDFDPLIEKRLYLALPLLELNPTLRLPDSKVRIQEVVSKLPRYPMVALKKYTETLRKELNRGAQ